MFAWSLKISKRWSIFLTATILFFSPVTLTAEKELALFPLAFYIDPSKDFLRQGIRSMLISRLSGEGFQLVGQDRLDPILNEEDVKGITSQDRAEALAKSLKAQYALFGSITSIGSNYSLDLALLDLSHQETPLVRVSEIVNEDALIPKLGDLAQRLRIIMEGPVAPIAPQAKEAPAIPSQKDRGKSLFQPQADGQYIIQPTGLKPMGLDLIGCDTGDLNGDGETELVVLSRYKLQIFNKDNEVLELKSSLGPGFGTNFIRVSVGDTDQDGIAEICVAGRSGESRPESTVYKWDGTFRKLYEQVGHLQIIQSPNAKGSKILFQDSTLIDFFSGGIWLMEWNEKRELVKKQEIKGLEDAQFYTLTFFDLNQDGKEEIIGMGKPDLGLTGRLYVWDKDGEFLWRSEDRFGGTNNMIRKNLGGNSQEWFYIPFNSRPVIADLDGDGEEEVLVLKNIPSIEKLENLKIFVKATMTAFEIQGTELFSSWTSREIDYCITDMQMSGNTLFLVGHKGRIANFGKEEGRIMWIE